MTGVRLVAIILIVVGVLGLAYGSISFTKEKHETKIGPVELEIKEKETINIPVWAGIASIAVGSILLLGTGKKE